MIFQLRNDAIERLKQKVWRIKAEAKQNTHEICC